MYASGRYHWNITGIARGWYDGTNTGMMFKATDAVESGNTNDWKKFYSIDYSIYATDWWPYLSIVFRNTNGLEDYWDYTAHGAGRAGTGYINNYSGNLVWVREDLGFGGNRMPVSISHIYNANDKQSNKFGLGLGWRTNYNQTVEQWSEDSSYYIWEDGDGTKHYFKHDSGSNYLDEDGLGLTLTVTSTGFSIQDDYGNTSYFDEHAKYALNNHNDEPNGTAKGNQLRLSSKMQNTVVNIVKDHSFENGNIWTPTSTSVSVSISSEEAFSGSKSLKVTPSSSGYMCGVKGEELDLLIGQTITFSAYVKTGSDTSVCLAVVSDGGLFDSTEYLPPNSDWTRLEFIYEFYDDEFPIYPQILCDGSGIFYVDCVQIEMEPSASRYNLLENNDSWGGSSLDNCWTRSSAMTSSDNITTLSTSAYEKLDNTVFAITGNPSAEKYVSQTIQQSGTAGDTYVLTGWGIGDATPENTHDANARAFGLKVILNNTDGTTTEAFAPFNPELPVDGNWQYTATAVVAEKAYSSVTVQAVYSYHCNTVYFDGIQLFQETFGSSYAYNSDGKVESVVDLQNERTSYEYNTQGDLAKILQNNKAKMTYTYDDYHNVKTATSEEGVVYEFDYDVFGNNISVAIANGTSKIISTATYSDDKNRLVSTTDALGKTTTYGYNENTNVLEWVQYPEDTAATRTNYTYDAMYRLASAAATTDTGTALTASYTYTNDMLTEIETGSTTYSFTYGAFAQRSSIQIGSRTLASYTYSDDQNRYLTQLDYGNDDYVQYTYDDQGRVICQRFEDGDTVSYTYDSTGAVRAMYDTSVYRDTRYYYDLTGRLSKYTESDTGHSVKYTYNEHNDLTELVETINGTEHTTFYTYDDDHRIDYIVNGSVEESTSYDAYGRLGRRDVYDVESWEITDGFTNVITYDYTYATGTETTEQSNYLKALTYETPWISGSVNYSYDSNGNISQYVSAWDGGRSTIGYVYDSANQLIRENNSGMGSTWVWTYDNAGNILTSKKYSYTTAADLSGLTPLESHTYTYGDADWGDLLTAYDGTTITHDGIGNPLSDGTWTYTWEHGRQLKAMSNGSTTWNYTYDASGMRKSRTNGSVTYSYVYNGDQLTQMTKGNDTLYFTYGSAGPVSVTWNGTIYYYVVNAQGDVIGIMEHTGDLAVEYRYNAWGEVTYSGYEPELAQLNPLRYRGYVYDSETGLYYVSSRYYDPEIGRFINADVLVSTGQGILGNNMFAYCRNNPVCRKDITGTTDVALLEDGTNLLDEEKNFEGGKISNGGGSTNAQTVNAGGSAQITNLEPQNSTSVRIATNNYAGTSGKTEVHHVVEQCQTRKSGFSKSQMRSPSNMVVLDYNSHRAISGYYSSKPAEFGGLRVRDWLAGQSFEAQTAFGWSVINRFYYQQCI